MIVSSQVSSVPSRAAAVFVILWISFRSVWAGAIGAVPLLLSILINFGIMGFLGINLDMVTSLISSIAIGIGIDYTIHFLNNYQWSGSSPTTWTR
jgi:predicted RND superfamily exporter protein